MGTVRDGSSGKTCDMQRMLAEPDVIWLRTCAPSPLNALRGTAYNARMTVATSSPSLPPLANDRFLRACLRLPTDCTPVWLMRQAGRYLPEYRATRDQAGSFMGLATNPELACEVTMQPLRLYDLDAAILFSDILTVPDAMGLGLSFAAGEGPKFAKVVRDEAAVAELAVPDMDKLRYVFDAVGTIRKALADENGVGKVPLIGFSGSPWTLACYMVEGGGSDDN